MGFSSLPLDRLPPESVDKLARLHQIVSCVSSDCRNATDYVMTSTDLPGVSLIRRI
jgi:hypothetical protein